MRSNHRKPLFASVLAVMIFFIQLVAIQGQSCERAGTLPGTSAPDEQCSENCCSEGDSYDTFACSPPISTQTLAYLTLNSFEEGGDGGGASSCDNQFHSDDSMVVALSTGWFGQGTRCLHNIVINGNGRSVAATVVDECDSRNGCDAEHGFQRPCPNNVVDASKAVWDALGVSPQDSGELIVTWSDT